MKISMLLREQELQGVPLGSQDHAPGPVQMRVIRAAVRVYYIGIPGSKASYWWPKGQEEETHEGHQA